MLLLADLRLLSLCRFAVMACCWALDPEERPKFQQLVQCLTEFHAALGAYV